MNATKGIQDSHIRATLTAWSKNLAISREALTRRLHDALVDWESSETLTAAQVYRAMLSDKDAALTRKALAEADRIEREEKEARKELVNLAEVEKVVWQDCLMPLRTELEQMPRSLCAMCNPQDQDTAQKVLEQWVEKVKANIREKK